MKKYFIYYLVIIISFTSCEKAFLSNGPNADNQLEVFDEFWNTFNEKYAMFEFKNVDWQTSYDSHRPMITENTSDEELFEILGDMVLSLRDGHTSLTDISRDSTKQFDILKGEPLNYDADILVTHLNEIIQGEVQVFMQFSFYTLLKGNIGYMQIPTFDAELTDTDINTILTFFKDTKGLIIDLRNNTGGSPSSASLLARHLTTTKIATGFERFKTGKGKNDFSDSPAFNNPAEGEKYTKPVMVLTNGLCYSATTTFIYQTNPLDHVTFIGSTTGGGSGSVADGFLANGWSFSLSTSEFIDNTGQHLDDGFDPDIEVWLDDTNPDIDEQIQRAINEIN